MIVGKDIQPTREIYYLGALVLNIIKSIPGEEADFFHVFQKLNEQEKVSITLYTVTLTWLFILGTISGSKGNIKKCF